MSSIKNSKYFLHRSSKVVNQKNASGKEMWLPKMALQKENV